jgi:hypothetical protein
MNFLALRVNTSRMNICIHIHIRTHKKIFLHIYLHTYIYLNTNICISLSHKFFNLRVNTSRMDSTLSNNIYVYIYIHTYTYENTYTYIFIYIHIFYQDFPVPHKYFCLTVDASRMDSTLSGEMSGTAPAENIKWASHLYGQGGYELELRGERGKI